MNKHKKEKIYFKKEKVVLSDILPYEVPVIFNNRYFYQFLIENKIEFKDGKVKYDNNIKGLNNIIELIFDNQKNKSTIPFEFKISHKNNDYRSLAIIHPIDQLKTVAFYNEFKETIKYFASVSKYSIRKPYKVAKTIFVNDYLYQQQKKSNNESNIEIHKSKDENLKTFFSYKKYSNIYKFFESYEYQRCEKKFTHLYKFDISKCFDSIYTHSISWSLYGKEIVKDNLKSSKTTFAGKFDALMQNMNYAETNGILIGSEVSRIFAELLLQQIDKNVFNELHKEEYIHKKDYEIFRYVDDYFLFCSDNNLKDIIKNKFIHHLKQFNLFINDTKSYEYSRPIITDLTIAKIKIKDLISNKLSIDFINTENKNNDKNWKIGFSHKDLIIRFKIIIKESNIEYKDVVNYSISIVEKKALQVILKIEKEENISLYKKDFISYFNDVLSLIFFIYTVAPRVSSTIKIVSLLSKLLVFIKDDKNISNNQKEFIYKKIFDESYQIINDNKRKKYVQNETLYLLIMLAELNNDYLIDASILEKSFLEGKMNYFSITTLLFYIKNESKYEYIKSQILEKVESKFNQCNKDNLNKNTELVMLLLDLLSCPFVDDKQKRELLTIFNKNKDKDSLIKFRKEWFIKWENFNLANEIEIKKSQEVYG
jgi:hypothetical protein